MNQENNNALVTPAPAILAVDAIWNGKCRPMPYTTEMIIAKREGRKCMTRRTRGLNKINENPDDWELFLVFPGDSHTLPLWNFRKKNDHSTIEIIKCPYGIVGDRLWVKETYSVSEPEEDTGVMDDKGNSLQCIAYKADTKDELVNGYKWKLGMFMPRWASRMTDEIVLIRCERLQEITESDCKKEGIARIVYGMKVTGIDKTDNGFTVSGDITNSSNLIKDYMELWDKINGKKLPSTRNPWLFVLGTKPISGYEDKAKS